MGDQADRGCDAEVRTTRYFAEQVLRKRQEITLELCVEVLNKPILRQEQPDGRFRVWGRVERAGDTKLRYLRVVTLADGSTIHNAFFDRGFHEDKP